MQQIYITLKRKCYAILSRHLLPFSCLKAHFYLPPADTGDYKIPCVRASVRASVRHVFTKAFLSLKYYS